MNGITASSPPLIWVAADNPRTRRGPRRKAVVDHERHRCHVPSVRLVEADVSSGQTSVSLLRMVGYRRNPSGTPHEAPPRSIPRRAASASQRCPARSWNRSEKAFQGQAKRSDRAAVRPHESRSPLSNTAAPPLNETVVRQDMTVAGLVRPLRPGGKRPIRHDPGHPRKDTGDECRKNKQTCDPRHDSTS